MLKQFLITYGEKKMFGGHKNAYDTVWAYQARSAIKQFHKRYPNVPIFGIYVQYEKRWRSEIGNKD